MDLFSQSHFADVEATQSQDLLQTGVPKDILLQSERGFVLTDTVEHLGSAVQAHLAPIAAGNPQLVKLVSHIFNESFGYRPDGRPYRLGPKSVSERLLETDHLLVAGDEQFGVGYLFGKEIASSQGKIAWIESMAVLPLYRRRGIATAMVKRFWETTRNAPHFGCATPNPIAALIVSRVVPGKLYVGQSSLPPHLCRLLKEIKQNCFDLRGCSIDEQNLTIKTGFSPLSRSDERDWNPRMLQAPPLWWSWVQHLPNEYEALLIVER